MESGKRKRADDGVGDDRRTRSRGAEADQAVTDEEVEEFFAILRRMRDASRCLAVDMDGGGAGRPREVADGSKRGAGRWSPAFAREDFAGPGAGNDDGGKGRLEAEEASAERVTEHATPRCLDLNAEPEPEALVVSSPRGESTAPRCAPAPA
ncbi:protein NEGATIVE REGULATOR OF RESISTANCE [Phoenix dactylifera]|uniref:Protein NEGATIVE REGULATOR OF RESISTANCE n=1 Tax=Phoenix dactylifera TaxID=42345 RepID=A0A8B7CEZ3_PHODC|nr:protein NEGATIVE REGULATOR OF RESISTANCE [Phoenix dactylifera]